MEEKLKKLREKYKANEAGYNKKALLAAAFILGFLTKAIIF
jgi:hypothetical protein